MSKKKKILVIISKTKIEIGYKRLHFDWVKDPDILHHFDISFWGPHYSGTLTLQSLKNTIDKIKPDYVYCCNRGHVYRYLPDLSSIKNVPKIFVELDTYKYDPDDLWYKQFDRVLCRANSWNYKYSPQNLNEIYFKKAIFKHNKTANIKRTDKQMRKFARKKYLNYISYKKNMKKWCNIELFRWSIKEEDIFDSKNERKGINFVGTTYEWLYPYRLELSNLFKNKIMFLKEWDMKKYLNILRSSSALLCSTESIHGDFIPGKLFEFAASGAAIITNCDLKAYNMKDLDRVVIKYDSIDELKEKIKMDFTPYWGKASEVMREHTHSKRYKEIFV